LTRLLIAAPSPVVRAGLESLVASNPSLDLAGSFPDLASVEELRPDVVLAALSPADLSAAANGFLPAYVLLTGESQPAWTADALRLGIRALLPRDASAAGILAAVEAAASGLAVVSPADLEALLHASPQPAAVPETAVLTPREMEVLRLMAEGAANKNIAWKLSISEHTVKFHIASIFAKLNAGTRTEAVTQGIRRGLLLL
jgi:two-component system, NarL family, response regulator YdfI